MIFWGCLDFFRMGGSVEAAGSQQSPGEASHQSGGQISPRVGSCRVQEKPQGFLEGNSAMSEYHWWWQQWGHSCQGWSCACPHHGEQEPLPKGLSCTRKGVCKAPCIHTLELSWMNRLGSARVFQCPHVPSPARTSPAGLSAGVL